MFYDESSDKTLHSLQSSPDGLTSDEAKNRLLKFGHNALAEKKKKGFLYKFFKQFADAMIIILLIASAVSFAIAIYEKDAKEFIEPILILVIVILNAVIGVLQENKAEKALEALKKLSGQHAKVIRDGKTIIIDATDLVKGDVIELEAGDYVPADARLILSANLKCEESALTGESVPSEKDANFISDEKAPLADRKNMVYSGCSVTYGTAKAVVTATGMETEVGKIASLIAEEKESSTPLQQKLASLGKILGVAALALCAVIFIIGLIDGLPVLNMFMVAVSLAVSAIPEGLPAIVTIILSIGVQKMVKRNAIVKKLPAVETLGCASVICSDKTGTLTQNKMTLVEAKADGQAVEKDFSSVNEKSLKLLKYATLCCNGSVSVVDGKEVLVGDPTETSIISATAKAGFKKEQLEKDFPRIYELPFDSDRKLMTTVNVIDNVNTVIVKGAFDILATRCNAGNLSDAERTVKDMASRSLRTIAVAYKTVGELTPSVIEDLEKDLTFMGVVAMIDPPRPEAKEAVSLCKSAGIKTVMITGDHVTTAAAIAKELGILNEGERAITGAQLDEMSEEELSSCVRDISVYARVSPENKIRIVKAWQAKGEVVAMTGDGVNDAPALKAADIGCAMGITGTDVAKGAADMTLTDDNFSTLVHAVKEGRGIYSNIKKVVGYLLGTNIAEILIVFLAMLLFKVSPLSSIQLLWINLITDSLPAISLGMERVSDDVMSEKPRGKKEGLFAHHNGLFITMHGFVIGAIVLTSFIIGLKVYDSQVYATTMAFITIALCEIVQAYNMRSEKSLFRSNPFSNKTLNLSALSSVLLVFIVSLTPKVNSAFSMGYMPCGLYFIAIGLALVSVLYMEIFKIIAYRKK